MWRNTVRLTVLLFLSAAAGAPLHAQPTPGMPGQPALVFTGVTVITMEGEQVVTDQDVVVRNGLVASMTPTGERTHPEDARRVDSRGGYLVPGLAEMHAHIPQPGQGRSFRDRVLFLYLAAGVTTVRGMLGHESHLRLRRELEDYTVVGPRLITSGPSFNAGTVNGPDHATRRVHRQHEAGYDFLKLHPGLSRAEYDAIVAAAAVTGMPLAGHVSRDVGLARTLEAGQATIDHLDGYMQALVPADAARRPDDESFFGFGLARVASATRIESWARRTAAAGVWNVPTQSLIENVALPDDAETPALAYMPRDTVQQWRRSKREFLSSKDYDAQDAQRFVTLRRQLITALHEAGAGLLLGSDAPQVLNVPGFAAHRELEALVAAGLSPSAALATGTRNPARFFGATGRFGIVREGLSADLILLSADPRADIRNIGKIEGVVARGRWLSRDDLDAGLARLSN